MSEVSLMERLLACAIICTLLSCSHTRAPEAQPRVEPLATESERALRDVRDLPGLPRVLLIGDSISIGYTLPVRELLKDKANVHRIPANGGTTANGLNHLEQWIGTGKWDVIHFNFGLHDLKIMDSGQRQTPLADYERNLQIIVRRLKGTGAQLIWCTTTPVPDAPTQPPRKNEDVLAYNALAQTVMHDHGVTVSDLYAFAWPRAREIQQPSNVHYTPSGYRTLAQPVAAAIETVLVGRAK